MRKLMFWLHTAVFIRAYTHIHAHCYYLYYMSLHKRGQIQKWCQRQDFVTIVTQLASRMVSNNPRLFLLHKGGRFKDEVRGGTSFPHTQARFILHFKAETLLAMLVMKLLMSSWVGQLFWQGASAHLRHLAASFRAPRSLSVVCLMSSKLFSLEVQV